jgi:DNA repair protein RadC
MKKVHDIPEFNRPREKLKERGPGSLNEVELVASILGRGSPGHEVMSIATQVARVIDETRGHFTMADLMKVTGMGEAKACQFLAAFELARRYLDSRAIKITRAEDVVPFLQDIASKTQEHFVCFSLNGANEIIEKRIVTVGLLDRSQVHPREVFADVIADRAAAVLFAHNHPSGELRPSDADLRIHGQLIEAARILGLQVFDHIIVTKKGFYSFREEGLVI